MLAGAAAKLVLFLRRVRIHVSTSERREKSIDCMAVLSV